MYEKPFAATEILQPHAWTERIDTGVAHPARMYDYYLGGKDNYEADRAAAAEVIAIMPQIRAMARANRAFLGRAVRHLAGLGVRQFLDIGTGIPGPGNTTDVAHEVAPDARVVYVDNDPIVLVHAQALLAGHDPGHTTVVEADLRDAAAILGNAQVRSVLDFDEPIGVLLVAVLHFVRDNEDPYGAVAALREALAPGSYLVLSHGTADFDPERVHAAARPYDRAAAPIVVRAKPQVARFFDGFDLLEPGLVQVPYWRPDGEPDPEAESVWFYGGVGARR